MLFRMLPNDERTEFLRVSVPTASQDPVRHPASDLNWAPSTLRIVGTVAFYGFWRLVVWSASCRCRSTASARASRIVFPRAAAERSPRRWAVKPPFAAFRGCA